MSILRSQSLCGKTTGEPYRLIINCFTKDLQGSITYNAIALKYAMYRNIYCELLTGGELVDIKKIHIACYYG